MSRLFTVDRAKVSSLSDKDLKQSSMLLLFICNATEVEQFIPPRGIETVSCHWLIASLISSVCQLEYLLVFGDGPDKDAELLPKRYPCGA